MVMILFPGSDSKYINGAGIFPGVTGLSTDSSG